MPVITIDTHRIDAEQKATLIRDLTAKAMETIKMPAQAFTVIIHELDDNAIGCAGQTRTEMMAKR